MAGTELSDYGGGDCGSWVCLSFRFTMLKLHERTLSTGPAPRSPKPMLPDGMKVSCGLDVLEPLMTRGSQIAPLMKWVSVPCLGKFPNLRLQPEEQ